MEASKRTEEFGIHLSSEMKMTGRYERLGRRLKLQFTGNRILLKIIAKQSNCVVCKTKNRQNQN